MNKLIKHTVAIFVGLLLLVGGVEAQRGHHGRPAPAPSEVMPAPDADGICPMHFAPNGVNLVANQACYLPEKGMFVVIDSIDCAVDLLQRDGATMKRIGRFTTDVAIGRHDLKNILRPVSVSFANDKILVLASSKKDSSFLAVVGMEPVKCSEPNGVDTLKAIAIQSFSTNAYAFSLDPKNQEIILIGKNPVGYDFNMLSFANGMENISKSGNFHYHVPKQAERIQASDPHGAGLAIVAILVVFFALVCINFIMGGYGKLIQRIQNRKSTKVSKVSGETATTKPSSTSGEVYAAIAAAIYAYEEDLHDEEDTVITIQKVERAWTPWNAKFYNMNRYFSTRR